MTPGIRAYADLLRIHFAPVWPLIFCAGLFLAFGNYGGFSWGFVLLAALIGLLGFEAGMVLNDYVDRDYDRRDVEAGGFTQYWRPFGGRPLAAGEIPASHALALFLVLAASAAALTVLLLPFPHNAYVLAIGLASYGLEAFYQLRKRDQRYPVAQLVGRIDLALFPVAGYLCAGFPDATCAAIFLFLYPWAEAHLATNDLADIVNDRARGMQSVTVLSGEAGTVRWIHVATAGHLLVALAVLPFLGWIARAGFVLAMVLILVANYLAARGKDPASGLRALPLFHASLAIYAVSVIVNYFL